jgi:hypothetical protein
MSNWEKLTEEAKVLYPDIEDVPLFRKAGEKFNEAVKQAEQCNIAGTIEKVGYFGDVAGQMMEGIRVNELPNADTRLRKKNYLSLIHLLDDMIAEDLPWAIRDALKDKCGCKGK